MTYGSDAPLFYYITRLLISKKVDICFFEFEWNKLPLDEGASKAETIEIIKSEIVSSIDYIKQHNSYKQKFLFSKSIGSLVSDSFPEHVMGVFEKKFYFTPFVDVEKCIGDRSFLYYGGNDPYIGDKYKIDKYTTECHYYPSLNHSMTVDDDIHLSIKALEDIISDFEKDYTLKLGD